MKMKSSFFLFLASFAVLIPLRIYLCLGRIDAETGFYLRPNPVGILFTALFLLTLLVLAILPHIGKVKNEDLSPAGNKLIGLLGLVLGFLFIVETVSGGFGNVSAYLKNLSSMPALFSAAAGVAGFISGLLFVFYGMLTLFSKPIGGAVAALIMLPSLWCLFLMMHRFLTFTNIVSVSNRMILILFLGLGALFILGHARVVTNVYSGRGVKDSVAYGLGAAIAGFVYTIPRTIASLAGMDPGYEPFASENLLIFFFALYAAAFALYVLRGYHRAASRGEAQSRALEDLGREE
ncbi:hypothetical protein [Zongyangia hominis]|uniref:Uncharacterized protein n=1 Tax=Zongyangia hominis TaxID=2763677 RepID=A0A926EBV8_9FIRM|nr:hypothetical protein [Zongyangia hominis]MBC8571042.1 hypothetical protein [Zongyangia hominis]